KLAQGSNERGLVFFRQFLIVLFDVAFLLRPGRLLFFQEQAVAQYQGIHLRSHETSVGVIRRAYDGLAANVERGVDYDGASGQFLESLDEVVVLRVIVTCYRLYTSRIIHVRHRRDIASFLPDNGKHIAVPMLQPERFSTVSPDWTDH